MLVAIIGRITGAAGTCIASTVGTVGTAGTAVGIPVTGAPRTSCSNLGWGQDRHHSSGPCTNSGTLGTSRQRLHPCQALLLTPAPTIPKVPFPQDRAICRAYRGLEGPGLWLWDGSYRALSRALQGHLRLHLLQAFLAALARDASTRARDHRSSCTRESRGWPRPGHRCCRRCRHYYRLNSVASAGSAVYSLASSGWAPADDVSARVTGAGT